VNAGFALGKISESNYSSKIDAPMHIKIVATIPQTLMVAVWLKFGNTPKTTAVSNPVMNVTATIMATRAPSNITRSQKRYLGVILGIGSSAWSFDQPYL
jgi:hypothetical protein